MVNGDGMFVLDSNGAPIVLDPAEVKSFSIAQDGSIIAVMPTARRGNRHAAGDR